MSSKNRFFTPIDERRHRAHVAAEGIEVSKSTFEKNVEILMARQFMKIFAKNLKEALDDE